MTNVWDEGRWKTTKHASFDFTARHIFDRMRRHLDPSGLRILELGAGTGQLSYLWLEAGAAHVTLVDNSPKAIELIRNLFRDIEPSRYTIVPESALEYTTEERFDLVFSSGLIEHFQAEQRCAIISQHLQFSHRDVFIVHPSNRLYNRLFDRTPMARKRYGFAQTYSTKELDDLAQQHVPSGSIQGASASLAQNASPQNPVIHINPRFRHERFHLFYTVPCLHNSWGLCRLFDATPWPRLLGGLVLSRRVDIQSR